MTTSNLLKNHQNFSYYNYQVEEKQEVKRPSIKKGVPKPEEPVDELSGVKLSKAPTKPTEQKLEEPQQAKAKKSVAKVIHNH